jgi:hypothetical protein
MVSQPPSKVSGLLYGLGLGGFIDGHRGSPDPSVAPHGQRREPLPGDHHCRVEVNTLADGFLFLATWLLVLAASIAAITAWQQGRLAPNWSFHFGLVLIGWASSMSWRADRPSDTWRPSRAGRSWWAAFLGHRVSDLRRLLIVSGWLLHKAGLRAFERRGPHHPITTSSSHRDHARPYGRGQASANPPY